MRKNVNNSVMDFFEKSWYHIVIIFQELNPIEKSKKPL